MKSILWGIANYFSPVIIVPAELKCILSVFKRTFMCSLKNLLLFLSKQS